MIRYVELLSPYRKGEIIRLEGRKHFRFSFGTFRWERTTMFQPYLTEEASVFAQYRELDETVAQRLLVRRGKAMSEMLKKAEEIARQVHSYHVTMDGQPVLDHIQAVAESLPDWEEKTVAWLRWVCAYSEWTLGQLSKAGFDGHICHSLRLLAPQKNQSCGDYLTKLRQDRIARRVKIADLSRRIEAVDENAMGPQERRYVENLREARKYLFGDIAEYTETPGVSLELAIRTAPVPVEQIYRKLYPLSLGGRKVPHGMSNPVLSRYEGRICLAFFVYPYTREQLSCGLVGRPVSWILADVEKGDLLAEHFCDGTELLAVGNPVPPLEADALKMAYRILDEVREKYLEEGTVDFRRYGEYLKAMLSGVPASYHGFYRELSIP